MKRILCYAAFMLAMSFSQLAASKNLDSMRCGNEFVEVGMHINELREVCGSVWVPSEIRTDIKHYKTRRNIVHFVESLPPTANTYQYWVYRKPGRFNTWLWITDGYIRRIVYGDRH